jgi:hypothetical protein
VCNRDRPIREHLRRAPRSTARCSFEQLVGAAGQGKRDRDAKRLGRPEVNDKLDFRHLLDRQLRRLLSFENASGKDAELAIDVRNAGSVACKPAGGNASGAGDGGPKRKSRLSNATNPQNRRSASGFIPMSSAAYLREVAARMLAAAMNAKDQNLSERLTIRAGEYLDWARGA